VWREYLLNENNEYYFTLIAMIGMWQMKNKNPCHPAYRQAGFH
jgi:hypothetical protein